jgi:hypothetical protein
MGDDRRPPGERWRIFDGLQSYVASRPRQTCGKARGNRPSQAVWGDPFAGERRDQSSWCAAKAGDRVAVENY